MYDLSAIVSRLQQETSYTVKLGYSAEASGKNLGDPPVLCVNYETTVPKGQLGEVISDFPVNQTYAWGEVTDLVFIVQINCKVTDFPSVWDAVHTALTGWEVPQQDINNSPVFPMQGFAKNVDNGRIVWFYPFRIEIPY
jgi:hypothetical protein